jgi:hypothetical protein
MLLPLARTSAKQLPRLVVLDEDYRRAVLGAQSGRLTVLLGELASGEVTRSPEWLAEVAKAFEPT